MSKKKPNPPEILGWRSAFHYASPNPSGCAAPSSSEEELRAELRQCKEEVKRLHEAVRKIGAENDGLEKRSADVSTKLRRANSVLDEIEATLDEKLKRSRVDDNQE
jgi:hypothetical protein